MHLSCSADMPVVTSLLILIVSDFCWLSSAKCICRSAALAAPSLLLAFCMLLSSAEPVSSDAKLSW